MKYFRNIQCCGQCNCLKTKIKKEMLLVMIYSAVLKIYFCRKLSIICSGQIKSCSKCKIHSLQERVVNSQYRRITMPLKCYSTQLTGQYQHTGNKRFLCRALHSPLHDTSIPTIKYIASASPASLTFRAEKQNRITPRNQFSTKTKQAGPSGDQ